MLGHIHISTTNLDADSKAGVLMRIYNESQRGVHYADTKCPRNSRRTKLKDGSHCLKMDALKDPPCFLQYWRVLPEWGGGVVCSHEHMIYNESQRGVHYAEHQVPKELEENQVKRWLNKLVHTLMEGVAGTYPHLNHKPGCGLQGWSSNEGVTEGSGSGGRADA
ncbi:hypothetical protein F7725_025613 [Dissostichus mawsoni]|uniref:Uncharacterized protein n=1 Tax=Dissostichus mawsoni TaxID=36200 RepID=A0A7J5XCK5_DISMA|nr:hypothetical protein F7725_025613 [Dissostichus mawsoni]